LVRAARIAFVDGGQRLWISTGSDNLSKPVGIHTLGVGKIESRLVETSADARSVAKGREPSGY